MGVVISWDKFAFQYYHSKYVEVCLSVSKEMNLRKVHFKISAFIYEFGFILPDKERKLNYQKQINSIYKNICEDNNYHGLLNRDDLNFKQEIGGYSIYYKYFLEYLRVLSTFVAEMGSTYMPRTKLQRKMLRYKDDSPFYQKLHEYKEEIFKVLGEFSIEDFREKFNIFITYIYAYDLFINQVYIGQIEDILSDVLSFFIDNENISVLSRYGYYSKSDMRFLQESEFLIHTKLSACNDIANVALSQSGVLLQILEKQYGDRYLI
jgi:hypothetical protein